MCSFVLLLVFCEHVGHAALSLLLYAGRRFTQVSLLGLLRKMFENIFLKNTFYILSFVFCLYMYILRAGKHKTTKHNKKNQVG